MKKGFLDGYKTYDTSAGFGNTKKWQKTFRDRFTKDEAKALFTGKAETPHEILEVAISATKEEIKKAFRRLITRWHPDKNPNNLKEAEEKSKLIIAAYTLLK